MAKERLDKLLSHQGYGSRKDIKKLLRSHEVLVNGKQIFDSAFQMDVQKDILTLDGEEIVLQEKLYLMMNKIMHTVCANKGGEHQTVFELLGEDLKTPYLQEKLHLVGRLDMDTEGLLLFTTDGTLTHKLISPKSHVNKTYFCILEHPETEEHKSEIKKLFEQGIKVASDDNDPEFTCEPAGLEWATQDDFIKYTSQSSYKEALDKNGFSMQERELSQSFTPQNQIALLTIYEGKYHQVKRMFTAVGNKVIFLKRISVGSLQLDNSLRPGEYRALSSAEIELLV